jgi:hypothetical protein
MRRVSVGITDQAERLGALDEVEAAFQVRLDRTQAEEWETAGDVFQALRAARPELSSDNAVTWATFAQAITSETRVDPASITPESPLTTRPRKRKSFFFACLFAIGAVGPVWAEKLL